jgi:hypothetical protein
MSKTIRAKKKKSQVTKFEKLLSETLGEFAWEMILDFVFEQIATGRFLQDKNNENKNTNTNGRTNRSKRKENGRKIRSEANDSANKGGHGCIKKKAR